MARKKSLFIPDTIIIGLTTWSTSATTSQFFFLNRFDLPLVESADVEPEGMEGRL